MRARPRVNEPAQVSGRDVKKVNYFHDRPVQFAAVTLPWKQLRSWPDLGDWQTNSDYSPAVIACADTGSSISNMGILVHEQHECFLCWLHGVKEEDVTAFDQWFFKQQEEGLIEKHLEPGHDARAPYHREHVCAERMEKQFVEDCGMSWSQHTRNCESIYKCQGKTKT